MRFFCYFAKLRADQGRASSFARLFGRVMPFWMAGPTLLNLLLLVPFEHLDRAAWRLAAVALAIQIFAVAFSIVAAVPINSRIATWTPTLTTQNLRGILASYSGNQQGTKNESFSE
jgi:hypothetical protein